MLLKDIVDNERTDKNTLHSYLDLYYELLAPLQYRARNVLEVGVFAGGSIKLWHDFFPNATVYGIDNLTLEQMQLEECITNNPRVILKTGVDGYSEDFVKTNFVNRHIQYDFMLDDGPHTLESMITFIKLYSQLMSDIGILIVEDVKSLEWIAVMYEHVPEHLKQYVHVYDLRQNKGRYDDIVFVINKNKLVY
jgi:cephalosporin hydroxylase